MLIAAGPLLTRATFLATSCLFKPICFLGLPIETTRLPLGAIPVDHGAAQVQDRFKPPETTLNSFLVSNAKIPSSEADEYYRSAAPCFRSKVNRMLEQDPTLAGPLIRLAFHDATTWEQSQGEITGGPNGSIQYELDWSENRALSKPLQIVQTLREETGLSLADAIALAGASAIEHAGGPKVPIRLGRTDVTAADPYQLRTPMQMTTERSKVASTMPSAALDSDGLRLYFGRRLGLKEDEIVALSGVHGLGRHVSLLGMSKDCLKNLTRTCLEEAPQLLPFVTSSVDRFSNGYYQYLLRWYNRDIKLGDVAFIPTDVALVVDKGFRRYVQRFARDEATFPQTFVRAYQKLVETTATTSKRF